MKLPTLKRQARSSLTIVSVAIALLSTIVGCTKPTTLTLQSLDGGRRYVQAFPAAYFTGDDSGQYDLVLVDDGLARVPPQRGPIESAQIDAFRQVVHCRVLWRPQHGQRANDPAATNAVLYWEIVDPETEAPPLRYDGTAFVRVSGSGDVLTFSVRSASLTPSREANSPADPLGPSTVRGTFRAVRNAERVRQAIALLNRAAPAARP